MMPPAPSLEQSVTSYLASRHCRPTPEWIRTQTPTSNQDPRFSPDLVYQAWIKLNWAEEAFKAYSLPALPPDVHRENVNLTPKTLTGSYLVQVTNITNISVPRSRDLDEIADVDEEEDGDDEDESSNFGKLFKKGAKRKGPAPKGSKKKPPNKRVTDQQRFSRFGARMLRLAITDGHIHAVAIEYMPIPTLTTDQHVNSKLLLTGTFVVRAGTFLLRPQNVKVVYMTPVGPPSWRNQQENNPNLLNGVGGNHNGNAHHQNGHAHNNGHLLNGIGGHQNNNANNNADPDNYEDLLEDDLDLDDLL